jgi:hypothetical protein
VLRRGVAFGFALVSGIALGCGSSSGSGPDGGPGGSACDTFFQALAATSCTLGPKTPASEVSQVETLFDMVCAKSETLPGTGLTDSFLNACATALNGAGPCDLTVTASAACQPTGSLAAGAACNGGAQCQSGACQVTTGATGCGKCAKALKAGETCGTVADGACVPGTVCESVGGGRSACSTIVYGTKGASCASLSNQCAPQLTCSSKGMCVARGEKGAPCLTPLACAVGLACVSGLCTPPSAIGQTCTQDTECASGLGCSQKTAKCGSVTWVSPGGSCGDLSRCLNGGCSPAGKCPEVLADGKACDPASPTAICGQISSCLNGKCEQQDSTVCK